MPNKTIFIQFSEYDCRQVNLKIGRKYHYWYIEPDTKPIKTNIGEVPDVLKGKDISGFGLTKGE